MIAGCIRLIDGEPTDAELLLALGGPGATKFLDGRPHTDCTGYACGEYVACCGRGMTPRWMQ